MPSGLRSEKRPADPIGVAVEVTKIATGKTETLVRPSGRKRGGKAGGSTMARLLSASDQMMIAKKSASVRWEQV